jgi:acyl dehydratase
MLGKFFHEIEVATYVDLGAYEFNEVNISSYSRKFAPVPFQLHETVAAEGLFGAKVAAGFHICSAWMACFVAKNTEARNAREAMGLTLPEIGPSPGLERIVWPAPVFAGDVIDYSTEITAKRVLRSRSEWGLVSSRNTGRKKSGTMVLEFQSMVLVHL